MEVRHWPPFQPSVLLVTPVASVAADTVDGSFEIRRFEIPVEGEVGS